MHEYGVEQAFLFGSAAKGTMKEERMKGYFGISLLLISLFF
jgi:hypothetical protein